MNQLYKNEIEKMMRSNSASIVEDIKKEGYGLMTGSMIVIALNKVPEILFEQLAPMASEFGATANELKSFLEETNRKIINEYVEL